MREIERMVGPATGLEVRHSLERIPVIRGLPMISQVSLWSHPSGQLEGCEAV